MSRTAAIDFGAKRTGIAISDPLGMIANGLETVETFRLLDALRALHQRSEYSQLVVGQPMRLSGEASDIETKIREFIAKFEQALPAITVIRMDERFTSKIAAHTMIEAGAKRKQRRDKGMLDKISATLLLQEYLDKQRGG